MSSSIHQSATQHENHWELKWILSICWQQNLLKIEIYLAERDDEALSEVTQIIS